MPQKTFLQLLSIADGCNNLYHSRRLHLSRFSPSGKVFHRCENEQATLLSAMIGRKLNENAFMK